ncbi:MAG TPA: hypothetical protein PLY87_19045 [Planctomycetaceae bacterium]|nr:hypothetical protein [Planctomycetaceae bacterium]HQZ67200.1 hypothetical protein [Planctomycetaceae bacterium]
MEAKRFFGIDRFCDLYDRIEIQIPEDWKSQFKKSKQYQEWIAPLKKSPGSADEASGDSGPRTKVKPVITEVLKHLRGRKSQGIVFTVRQCWTLIDRAARLQWADRTTLGVMLAQPLVSTALICAVCRELPVIDFSL